jgi:hypothetical protein
VPRSKNEWSYTSAPQYAFMAWCLVKKSTRIALPLQLLISKFFVEEIAKIKIAILYYYISDI